MLVKRWIVRGMEDACDVLDRAPFGIGYRTRLGCPRGLALWSSQLDERWGTGVWTAPDR
jgi:hypothetical protein